LEAFGAWVATTSDAWPAEARASAHRELIDIVAVMIPGAVEPATQIALKTMARWGLGDCAIVGSEHRLSAPFAALVNGTAGHALDLDDNFDPPKAHATTVLAPALFALGEEIDASGAAIIDAYIVGLQIMGRVGQGVNPTHRNRGWHATATVGALGAAAACARLLKLDQPKATAAISIATSMAAGFMSQFGTMTKPLHAGLAAKAGVMAASLARDGLTAGMETLDGRTGMNRLMVGPDYESLRDAIQNPEHGQVLRFETEAVGEPLLITHHGFRVKRFANCGASHRAMDAILDLKAAHGFGPDDVARVDVHLPRVHVNNLMYDDPQNGLQSKFSFPHCLSLCLMQDRIGLEDFTDQAARRPDLRALYPRLHLHPIDKLEGECPTRVEITLHDGRHLSETRPWPKGSLALPFSMDDYWEKYESCVAGYLPADDASALRRALRDLPQLSSIAEMTRHFARPFGVKGSL
jgi:2-methylcitrate dehydratase PrpD